ncbi:MAG TPA: DUF624 domain-containing protein [Anaerolineales bacterium]
MREVGAALRIVGLALRDTWQELWTILIVNLLFLLGVVLIIPGPPAILALFYYGNNIAHGEDATERDFLRAIREYWGAAWRWGLMNLIVIGVLTGDYYLIGKLMNSASYRALLQGMYITLLGAWLMLQLFTLPFLFEQQQPRVIQAVKNAAVFIRKNLILVIMLTLLLGLSLVAGILAFMLTFALGGAFLAFASNRAVINDLASS